MRIQGKDHKRRPRWIQILILGLVGVVVLLLVLRSASLGGEDFYFCDMERTTGGGDYYKSQGKTFSNGRTQSSDAAFAGRHSAKCSAENQYGPGVEFKNVNGGDRFIASVWRNSTDGYGVLAFQGDWGFYSQATLPVQITGDWELVKREITIPLGVRNRNLKIFPYIPSKEGIVYFDNLEIRHIKAGSDAQIDPNAYAGPKLNLRVDDNGMVQLREKRLEAFSYGNLVTGKKDLVDAKLDTGKMEIPVRARLKGDLLDHLQGRQWSFRIVPEDGFNWRGMTEFSVHNSRSRYHLDEWIFHKIVEGEDLMTTRYDFIEMALNGDPLGIYAYEEHFNDGFLLQRERTPGVILSINEDGHWQYAPKQWSERPPWYESAQYEVFEDDKVVDDPERNKQFEAARDLLYGFLHGDLKTEQVFDTDKLATFLALVDLTNAFHSINYTNMRWYFDPHTALLEPIAYDGFTEDGTKNIRKPLFIGSRINSRTPRNFSPVRGDAYLHYKLFNDSVFTAKYLSELERVIQQDYINNIIKFYQADVLGRESFIQRGYVDYEFRWDYFFRFAPEIREIMYPLPEISIKAYLSSDGVQVESYHQLPMEVVGFGDGALSQRLPEPVLLESFNESIPARRYLIQALGSPEDIFVRTLGTEKLVAFPVYEWSAPEPKIRSERGSAKALTTFSFLSVNPDSQVVVQPGRHLINKDLIVPAGFSLRVWPGTELVLENGASIRSFGPVLMEGSAEEPILISSPSKDGGGVLVADVPGGSVFRHVVFRDLGNAGLTESSVSVFKTNVILENCLFEKSRAPNALGISNANYKISDCRVEEAAGDGLDLDFSSGSIAGLVVNTAGRDGLEVSGGQATLYNISIVNAREAGFNANRKALVTIGTIRIQKGRQGIHCTGESEVKIATLELEDIQQGIVVFKQEAVYNGARVEIDAWEQKGVDQLEVVEDGSRLRLGERWIN
ncbi:MAG: hypothetical protein GYB31_17820 [Bacteroidetes bacterium]|nr:hypothetical protein [Bacteroidota bacterium]